MCFYAPGTYSLSFSWYFAKCHKIKDSLLLCQHFRTGLYPHSHSITVAKLVITPAYLSRQVPRGQPVLGENRPLSHNDSAGPRCFQKPDRHWESLNPLLTLFQPGNRPINSVTNPKVFSWAFLPLLGTHGCSRIHVE